MTWARYLVFGKQGVVPPAELAPAALGPSADKLFDGNGLERGEALARDIEYMQKKFALMPHVPHPDGPGHTYARWAGGWGTGGGGSHVATMLESRRLLGLKEGGYS